MPTTTAIDKASPLWLDLATTLAGSSPIVPSPNAAGVSEETSLTKPQKDLGLALSRAMLAALQPNWNEMRQKFGHAGHSGYITELESTGFETAGNVYHRITGQP